MNVSGSKMIWKKVEKDGETAIAAAFKTFLVELELVQQPVVDEDGRPLSKQEDSKIVADYARRFHNHFEEMDLRSPQKKTAARKVVRESWILVEDVIDREDHRLNSMRSWRRTAQRRATDGEGLCRLKTADFCRGQDGRSARKQGRYLQGSSDRRHAVSC